MNTALRSTYRRLNAESGRIRGCGRRTLKTSCGVLLALLIPEVARAHGIAGDSGFLSGLNHPVFGFDHLFAMVTVGLLSAKMGGRALWTVPATFVLIMALGGVLGMSGVRLPLVEYGIALSVLALGSALVSGTGLPVVAAMGFVGVFAIFHGHAHGAEMPHFAKPALYALGFSLATAGLHILGAVSGYFALRFENGMKLLRVTGIFIAVSGIYFVTQV